MKVTLPVALILLLLATPASAQEAFVGETLISPRTSNESFLIDIEFHIVKTWHGASSPAGFAYLLPDGSVLRPCADETATWGAGGAGGRIQMIDANDNVVWDYLFSDSLHLQHHDVEPMPNGNALLIAWERKSQAEAIAAGRQSVPIGEVWPTLIAEIEPVGATGGNIVWEWHLWDHLIQDVDPTKANYGVIADHPELVDINWPVAQQGSFDHANAIDYNPRLDQIVYSARAMSEVYVIDHSTTTAEAAAHTGGLRGHGGDILYRWGNPEVYDRGTADDRYFHSVHGANWIDPGLPGAGGILIFNNGNRPGPLNDYSGVVDIHPPMGVGDNYLILPGQPFGPAAPDWVYEDPPGFYSENKGGAFRLPNGNTLICESNDNRLFEVTAAGVIVWAYSTPGELHRAPRYWEDDITGIAELPATKTHLQQNYPNPFNPTTAIVFSLDREAPVSLSIYDVAGRLVRTLVDSMQNAGDKWVTWDGRNAEGERVATGVYYYRMRAPGFEMTKKMILLQ